jgi:hypothetical protein
MFDNPLIWAIVAAVLGVTVVRKVIISSQGYEYPRALWAYGPAAGSISSSRS